jgi:myosin heavy subunit
VLQAVQVSRAGYPVRLPHEDFWHDYGLLAEKKTMQALARMEDKERAEKLLAGLEAVVPRTRKSETGTRVLWAVGMTLVFFKQEAFELLQAARLTIRNKMAVRVQSRWVGRTARLKYRSICKCVIKCQSLIRGKLSRVYARSLKKDKASIAVQAVWRKHKALKTYLFARRWIIRAQSKLRAMKAKRYVHELRRSP